MIPFRPDRPTLLVSLGLLGTFVLLYVTARVSRVVPKGSALERWSVRWAPAAQAAIVVLAVLWSVDTLYASDPQTRRWLTLLVLTVVVWSSRTALSDWWNGVVLRGDGTLNQGSRISWGERTGRVLRLHLRGAEVETEEGHRLRVPYTEFAREAVASSPTGPVSRSHAFTVLLRADRDPAEQERSLLGAAALSPWSAADPQPTVRLVEQKGDRRRFEVTVYPIGPAEGGRIERAVRESTTLDWHPDLEDGHP